jgi:hypothetical protein
MDHLMMIMPILENFMYMDKLKKLMKKLKVILFNILDLEKNY